MAILRRYLEKCFGDDEIRKLKTKESGSDFFDGFKDEIIKKAFDNENLKCVLIENTKNVISFDVKKCLWFEICNVLKCLEICHVFCELDHYIYGNLSTIKFKRDETLETNNYKCDFEFSRFC